MIQAKRKRLETTLKEHWVKKQKIETMKRKLDFIDKEINSLRDIFSEKEELIPSPSQVKFAQGGRRSGSSEYTPVEKALQIFEKNQLELYRRIEQLLEQKSKYVCRIKQYEMDIDLIEFITNKHLDIFERQVFEHCYCYGRSNIQIGIELNCGEATVRRKRAKILAKFSEFLLVEI